MEDDYQYDSEAQAVGASKSKALADAELYAHVPFPEEPAPLIKDIPMQAIGAFRDAANSVKNLAIDTMFELTTQGVPDEMKGSLEQGLKEPVKEATALPTVAESERPALRVGRDILQVLAPMGAMTKAGMSATRAGVAADYIAFDEHEVRLSEALKQAGMETDLTDWLANREDDSAFEARLKTTMEGLGIGAAAQGLFMTAKYIKAGVSSRAAVREATKGVEKSVSGIAKAKDAVDAVVSDGRKTKVDLAFRPDKETIDLATQRKAAEAIGTTIDDVQTGKALESIRGTKILDKANAITLAEESAYQQAVVATKDIWQRVQAGDSAARDEFFTKVLPDLLDISGKARDAFSDIARAEGFRGHSMPVRNINDIVNALSSEKPDELLKALSQLEDSQQLGVFLKNMANESGASATSGWGEKAHIWFMNSILSSPKTQIIDTVSNVVFTPWTKFEKIPAALIGRIRSGVTGNMDRVEFQEAGIAFQSMSADLMEGIRLAGRSLKGQGSMREAIAKTKIDNTTKFGSRLDKPFITPQELNLDPSSFAGRMTKLLNGVVTAPTSFMQTKDDLAKALIYRSNVKELATRRALNEGLNGSAFEARVLELTNSPIDDISQFMGKSKPSGEAMRQFTADLANRGSVAQEALGIQKKAVLEARDVTFTAEASKIASAMTKMVDSVPGGRFIVPFITTVDNLVTEALKRSPAAPILPSFRQAIAAGGAEADQAIARLTLGTGMMTLAYQLALDGRVTGDGPRSSSDRDALLQTGWRPRSILIGGEYIEYGRFAPLALLFHGAANMAEMGLRNNGELSGDLELSTGQYIALNAQAVAQTLTSQSWLSGVSDLFEGINRDDNMWGIRAINRLGAAMAVPNFATFFTQQINPTLQQTQTMGEAIASKVGMDVLPKRDMFGEPIQRDDYLSIFLPINISDPGETEPWLLQLAEDNAFPSTPTRRISLGGMDNIEITVEQREKILENMQSLGASKILKDIVNSAYYQSLPAVKQVEGIANSRRELILGIYSDLKEAATAKMVAEDEELQLRMKTKEINDRTTPALSPDRKIISEAIKKARSE